MIAIRCIWEKDSYEDFTKYENSHQSFSYYELILQHFHYQIDKQYTYNNSDTLLNDIKIFVTINWLTKVGYFCSSLLK